METKNEEGILFTIICNEERNLKLVIDWYNLNHKTDFEICKMIYDEVNFAQIKVSTFMVSDLFNLGFQFGTKEEQLRQKGEIDW